MLPTAPELGTESGPPLLCVLLAWDRWPGRGPTGKRPPSRPAGRPLCSPAPLLPPQRAKPIQSRREALPSEETGQLQPLLPAQLQPDKSPSPKREVGSEHQGTRGSHMVCSILAARDAVGDPREQTRACSGAGTSSAVGGTASKKER